ncbi:MAG: S24/S26 family peptidase [Ruminiclostridium sp.]
MNKSTFEQELERKGKLTYICVGVSMLPLLRQRKDIITIEKKQGRCKKYDVALYKRPNGSYVLHRVVEVREKDYVILGDNCLNKEYGITDENILGVMTSFVRGGREYSVNNGLYRLYSKLWYAIYPMRRLMKKAKSTLGRIVKRKK